MPSHFKVKQNSSEVLHGRTFNTTFSSFSLTLPYCLQAHYQTGLLLGATAYYTSSWHSIYMNGSSGRMLLCPILTSQLFHKYQFQLKFLSLGEAFHNSLTRSDPLVKVFMYHSLIAFNMTITLFLFNWPYGKCLLPLMDCDSHEGKNGVLGKLCVPSAQHRAPIVATKSIQWVSVTLRSGANL